MERTPRSRFGERLEEMHDDDAAEASEFYTLLGGIGWGVLPVIVGLFAFVVLVLKTMAIQAPFLFAGVLVVVALAVFVGWRTVRSKRDPSLTTLDS